MTIAVGDISSGGALTIGGAGTTIISSVISGSGSLTKTGDGTLNLTVGNSYTGATAIKQGVLNISQASSLGSATNAIVLGDTAGHKGILNYTGSGTIARGFSVQSGGGEIDVAASKTLTIATGGIAVGGSLTIGGAGATTISSVVSGGGSLTKSGGGTLTLSGNNTYTGTTYVSDGLLTLGSDTALSAGGLTINGNARLDLNGYNNSSKAIAAVSLFDGNIVGGTLAASSALALIFKTVSFRPIWSGPPD